MTAVDVDALDAARAAATASGCDVAFEPDELADIIAEVRRGRELREAVEKLAAELGAEAETAERVAFSTVSANRRAAARRIRAALAAVDAP